jgi:hypothetical protein
MKKLYDLETDEISLVHRGANKKKFLVFKSDLTTEGRKRIADENFALPKERKYPIHDISHARNALARVAQHGTAEEQAKVKSAVYRKYPSLKPEKEKSEMAKTAAKVNKDAGDMAPKKDSAVYKDPKDMPIHQEPGASSNAPLSDRAKAALKAMARIAAPHKDELKGEHVEMAMKEAGLMHGAGEDGDAGSKDEIALHIAYPQEVEEEHHMAAMGKAKKKAMKAYKKALSKLGYRKYPDEQEAVKAHAPMEDDDDDGDDVDKSGVAKTQTSNEGGTVSKNKIHKNVDLSGFPENQRRQLVDVFKAYDERTKELVKKNDELESELKKRDQAEKHREHVAKAAGFRHLGIPQDEIVETLEDAAKLGQKAYDRVVKQYETLNAQAEKGGLFSEIGSGNGGGAQDASARLDALVDSVVQKSDGTRTRAEIYDDVLQTKDGQRLYAEFKNGRRGGA